MTGRRGRSARRLNRAGPFEHAMVEALEARTLFSLVEWDGGAEGTGTLWQDPLNWVGDVLPVDGDDVVIASGAGVVFQTGQLTLHGLSSSAPLTVHGGTLAITAFATLAGGVTLDGGGLAGGVWGVSGPGLVALANTGNSLGGLTVNGDIALDADNAQITVTGGLVVNGLISMQGDSAALVFSGGAQTLGGNPDIRFDGFTGIRTVSADDDAVLTIASSVMITGERGRIGSGFFSGSGSVLNAGTIWADTDDGTIEVSPAVFTNTGTIRATGNGVLNVAAGSWTNSGIISINGGTVILGGTLDVTAGIGTFNRNGGTVTIAGTITNTGGTLALNAATGSWQFDGGQIIGGTISLSGGSSLLAFPLRSGRIAQATVNGSLSWTVSNFFAEFDAVTLNGSLTLSGFSTLSVKNGIAINGTLSVTGDDTTLQFDGAPEAISGNGSILLRHANCFLIANTQLTIPAGASVSGFGHIFGPVINQGSVASDTAGKTFIIGQGTFQNNGTVSIAAGAILSLGDSVSGVATFNNAGLMQTSGGTIRVGPTSNSGPVTLNNSGSIHLSSNASFAAGAQFVFHTITVSNSGTLSVETGASATFGTSIQLTPVVLNNTGIIEASMKGSISVVTPATTAQLGELRAAGGTVRLLSLLDNTGATLLQNATTGAWTLNGGSVTGGVISLSPGVSLMVDAQATGTLDGVRIDGSLVLSQAGARLRIRNGLTLFGTLTITGVGAALVFDGGSQLVTGKAFITFAGTKGSQMISADNGAIVTLDSGVSVTGAGGSGKIVSGAVLGGTGSFISNGTIQGTLTINVAGGFTNSGVIRAADGAKVTVTGLVTNYAAGTLTGGSWQVFAGSAIVFQAGPITTNAAAITLDSPSSVLSGLSGLSANSGTLLLSGGRDIALGSLVNSGVLDLGPGSDLATTGAFSQTGSGTLRVSISPTSMPTIAAGGSATLAGEFQVSYTGGCYPGDSSAFAFLTGASVTGTFSTFTPQSLGANRRQFLTYSPTGVVLNVWATYRDDG